MLLDYGGSKGLNKLMDQYNGRSALIVQILSGIVRVVFSAIPVSYRLLLRYRIGILTLTPITVILAFVWTSVVFDTNEGWKYVDEDSLEILGYTHEDWAFVPLKAGWYALNFPASRWLGMDSDWKYPEDMSAQTEYALNLQSLALVVALFILIRGFVILWWYGPKRVETDSTYNPFSLGLSFLTDSEDARQLSSLSGTERKRRYRERVTGPLLFIGGFGLILLIAAYTVPPQFRPPCLSLGLFFFLGGISVAIEAYRYQRLLRGDRIMQLATKAWAKEMALEYGNTTQTPKSEDSGGVYYAGKY